MDWDMMVAKVTLSSKSNMLADLLAPGTSTFWQSAGSQGKVRPLEIFYCFLSTFVCNSLFCCVVRKISRICGM